MPLKDEPLNIKDDILREEPVEPESRSDNSVFMAEGQSSNRAECNRRCAFYVQPVPFNVNCSCEFVSRCLDRVIGVRKWA